MEIVYHIAADGKTTGFGRAICGNGVKAVTPKAREEQPGRLRLCVLCAKRLTKTSAA